jgi:hypothetical protein
MLSLKSLQQIQQINLEEQALYLNLKNSLEFEILATLILS